MTRAFDAANRPVTLGMPDGLAELVRGYDAGDRLSSLSVGGAAVWQAGYDGSRLAGITRGNGLATALSYTAAGGQPERVVTGVPGADGAIADPIHTLELTWTVDALRRTKARRDTEALLYAFHYDEVGHLESLQGAARYPAVRRDLPGLAGALPNLPVPTGMT